MNTTKEEFENLNVHKTSKDMVYIICSNHMKTLEQKNKEMLDLLIYTYDNIQRYEDKNGLVTRRILKSTVEEIMEKSLEEIKNEIGST